MATATKKWTPKRNRSEEDRSKGAAGFIDLDEGQNFLAYALFEGDPAKDEPGYYEYQQHWVPGARGGTSVPCAGPDCPICEEGDKPRDVAYTAWLVLKDAKGTDMGEGQVLSFRANSIVIKQITEMRAEDEPPMGVLFRVSRLDDRGNYVLASKPKKPLTKTQVKEHLKASGIDYDTMVTNRLNKAMEGLSVARAVNAMDDDEDEVEETPKSTAKGKPAAKKKAPAQEEWPTEAEDITVVVDEVDGDGNTVTVTSDDYDGPAILWTHAKLKVALEDLEEGQTLTVSYATDDADDKVLSAEPEVAEAEEEEPEEEPESDEEAGAAAAADNDLPDELDDAEFEVVSVDHGSSTMEVKSDDLGLEFTLYFLDRGPASKVDFDDYEEGAKIIVSAEKDTVGDMVATKVPTIQEDEAPAKKAPARKTTPAKKGTPAKGKA